MAGFEISGIGVAGVAVAVPETVSGPEDLVANGCRPEEAVRLLKATGVAKRHVALPGVCASDLCARAATALMAELGWAPDTVDAILMVTQTPDYIQPATACVLHGKLGLSKHAAAIDVNLGCSGYIYGLWMAMGLASASRFKRVLLLAGDTMSRLVSPRDWATVPLFGDAGSATALEVDAAAGTATFCLGTDGAGWQHLIVPAGGARQPRTAQTGIRSQETDGNWRCAEDFHMNGLEVFAFTLREVPPLIQAVLAKCGETTDTVDAFVFHQANEFILKNLAMKMKIPSAKLVLGMREFGNTSSASIPLALVANFSSDTVAGKKVVLAGFGVGLSWGAVCLRFAQPRLLPVLTVPAHQGEEGEKHG